MRSPRHPCAATLILVLLVGCGGGDPTGPQGPPTNGLLAYLPFTGNADDSSGNGNHGTLLGGATASGALVLGNNATDMLTLPSSVMNGRIDFTFAAWLRIDSFRNNNHEVISAANANEDNALIFWYREQTDEWVVGVNNGSSAFATDASIEDGQWHHVTLVRSGSDARLYLNGGLLGGAVSVGSDQLDIDAGGLVFGQDQDAVGGGFAADESWAGAMDNLRIYSRALTAAEIQAVFQEAH